jgi:hypothetical protein
MYVVMSLSRWTNTLGRKVVKKNLLKRRVVEIDCQGIYKKNKIKWGKKEGSRRFDG